MHIVKKFSPKELFDLVWDNPVLRVAQSIGISDVGLSKACRKAGIALPARGHWAKPLGKRPKKPKAPTSTEMIAFRVFDPQSSTPAVLRPVEKPIRISVPAALENPHPLVRRWLSAVRKAKVVAGCVVLESDAVLNSRISKGAIERCGLLFDTLIKEAEALGYAWDVVAQRTQVTVQGEQLSLYIQERVKRIELPRPPRRPLKPGEPWQPDFSSFSEPRYAWEATGELSIHIVARTESHERKNWKDTPTGKLESKLGQILSILPTLATSVKSVREKAQARALEWQREERLRLERVAQAERTRKLRTSLVVNTLDWERAQRLEAFIDATIAACPADEQSQQQVGLWSAWARRQVQLLNPLTRAQNQVATMSVPFDPSAYHGSIYGAPKDPNGWWE